MSTRDADTRQPTIEPMPLDLLGEPLHWLFADHHRQRQLCTILETLAGSACFLPEPTEAAVSYLSHDLQLHLMDEEEGLFPLLRRRCKPEDNIESVLGVLTAEHGTDLGEAAAVVAWLTRARMERRPPIAYPQAGPALTAYAAKLKQHLAIENAVVLPIARMRLTAADLRALSEGLAARRGHTLPAVPGDNTEGPA